MYLLYELGTAVKVTKDEVRALWIIRKPAQNFIQKLRHSGAR